MNRPVCNRLGLSWLIVMLFCGSVKAETNPAWHFCEQHDGRGEIREDAERNQYSVCRFADGSSCDAFAFYYGECAPQSSPLVWQGFEQPAFRDYPVKVDDSAAWADQPVIDEDLADLFALFEFTDVIKESLTRPANFAGHLVLISFGHCGTGCRNFVLIDKLTGEVTMPDLLLFDGTAHVTAESRLLVLDGALGEGGKPGRHYFACFDGALVPITASGRRAASGEESGAAAGLQAWLEQNTEALSVTERQAVQSLQDRWRQRSENFCRQEARNGFDGQDYISCLSREARQRSEALGFMLYGAMSPLVSPVPLPTIYFPDDELRIADTEEIKLIQLAAQLRLHPQLRLRIAGHTEDLGSAERNLALGERMALTVKNYLEWRGIAAGRMQPASFGASWPVVFEEDEAARAQNRRVELVME